MCTNAHTPWLTVTALGLILTHAQAQESSALKASDGVGKDSNRPSTGKKLLALVDVNQDGKIGRDEMFGREGSLLAREFDRQDENADGFVDLRELDDWTFQLPPPSIVELLNQAKRYLADGDRDEDGRLARAEARNSELEAQFDNIDGDDDDRLSLKELVTHLRGSGPKVQSEGIASLVTRIIERSDQNGDGQLAEDEATGLFKLEFGKFDSDQDGLLTAEELEQLPNVMRSQRERRSNRQPTPPREASDQEASRLLEQHDSDGDGKLTQADGLRTVFARRFDELDTNSDGALDLNEIKASGVRPYSGKLFIELYDSDRDGQLAGREIRGPLVQRLAELDSDQNGALTEKEMDTLQGAIFFSRRSGASRAASGVQRNDPDFRPSVKAPSFTETNAPTVAIDEGHRNYHTKDGRFLPFAQVLEADGCKLVAHHGLFTRASLEAIDVLVIANASPGTAGDSEIPSAFTETEIAILTDWVEKGGSLMLLADHRPYGEAARLLGKAFDVEMSGGFVLDSDEDRGRIIFSQENRLLAAHPITEGSTLDKPVTSITSFTGQALKLPDHFAPLLSLAEGTVRYLDRQSIASGGDTQDVSDWHQGAIATIGQGRVAIFGEAGMFSAQVGSSGSSMGMNAPGAEQNQQFLLNVIHWLAHRL